MFHTRTRTPLAAAFLLAVATGAVAATSATAAGTAAAAHRDPVTSEVPAVNDALNITLNDGAGTITRHALACHPAAGTHPDAQAACDRLDALGGPLGPPPKGQMCSMVFGGPQSARITGTWRGAAVDESYNRANGCRTAQWQQMQPVLPGLDSGTTTSSAPGSNPPSNTSSDQGAAPLSNPFSTPFPNPVSGLTPDVLPSTR